MYTLKALACLENLCARRTLILQMLYSTHVLSLDGTARQWHGAIDAALSDNRTLSRVAQALLSYKPVGVATPRGSPCTLLLSNDKPCNHTEANTTYAAGGQLLAACQASLPGQLAKYWPYGRARVQCTLHVPAFLATTTTATAAKGHGTFPYRNCTAKHFSVIIIPSSCSTSRQVDW